MHLDTRAGGQGAGGKRCITGLTARACEVGNGDYLFDAYFSMTTSVKLDEGEGVRDGDRDAVVVVVLLTVADTERVGVVALEGRSDADELADGVTTFTPHTARLSEMSTTLLPAGTLTGSGEWTTARQ